MWSCAGVLVLATFALAITRDQFYPHGAGLDQRLPSGSDVASYELPLNVPIVFYGDTYETIYVSNFGVLSFRAEISTFLNSEFPLPYPSIAAFYSKIDTTTTGSVYYRETNDPNVLFKAEESVHNNFNEYYDFKPRSVFIATWLDVTYSEPRTTENRNSFQIAVISNGTETFVEFLYPERDIQWIQREPQAGVLPEAKAQAGFSAEDGRIFTLRGSGSHQIRNIVAWSNTKEPGKYIFRVGRIDPDGNIATPDQYNAYAIEIEEESKTCAQSGPSVCHVQARCVDYESGICCQCQEGFYGNGKSCIKDDVPLRVHGKVDGLVNDQPINDIFIQSYVVVADGRTYTALAQTPSALGTSLQFLNVLGGIVGWLFAKPSGTAKNGYQLTGALFNHTVDIFFPATGERVTIHQEFQGHDVFDQIIVESDIRGSIPAIQPGVKLDINEYQEQYRIIEQGLIRSESTRTFINKATGQTYEQRVSQTITYNPCRFAPTLEEYESTSTLKVTKNYLGYENKDNIVRYGMSNKITPLGQEDPCIQGRSQCGPHSTCVALDTTFTCVCEPGFSKVQTNGYDACVDIDECAAGTNNCDTNAECYNYDGSFQCRCKEGYEGNGVTCLPASPCRNCDRNARCLQENEQGPSCICNPGFEGDGQSCVPYDTVGVCARCSPNANCYRIDSNSPYICQCNPGFSGDGFSCNEDQPLWTTPTTSSYTEADYNDTFILPSCGDSGCICPNGYTSFRDNMGNSLCRKEDSYPVQNQLIENNDTAIKCNTEEDCPTNAVCSYTTYPPDPDYIGYCVCPEGYQIDANECIEKTMVGGLACSCGPNAECIETENGDLCVCNTGFHGDGYNCRPNYSCSNDSDCEYHAECRLDAASNAYVCQCIDGYIKDQNDACILDGLCNGAICVEHASCLYDQSQQVNYCQCDQGYDGSPLVSCYPQENTCEVANNCHPDAVCTLYYSGYQCVCRDGYVGDGYNCMIEANCRSNPYLCDEHASCIQTSDGLECQCNAGYTGNGTWCKFNPVHFDDFLVASDGSSVYRVPFQVTPKNFATPFNSAVYQIAVAVDVDCDSGRVYWGDVAGNAIKRATDEGFGYEQFLSNDVKSPEGISIDWSGRNIYWTDSKKLTIEVANMETRDRKVLFEKNGISNPRGIAVHPQRGKIFWSDWNRNGPKIEWANMDGSERGVFLDQSDVKLPNALAIDWARDRLCYSDAGYYAIKCVSIDTHESETIAANCSHPFGLAIYKDTYYWTDWKTLKIEYVDKSTNLKGQVPIATTSRRLYGVAVGHARCPAAGNVCEQRSGGCGPRDLCLPNGYGGRTCVPTTDSNTNY